MIQTAHRSCYGLIPKACKRYEPRPNSFSSALRGQSASLWLSWFTRWQRPDEPGGAFLFPRPAFRAQDRIAPRLDPYHSDVAKVETTADRTKPRQLEELQNSAGMGGKAEKTSLLRTGKACALL